MKRRHWQVIWEVVAHLISLVLLICFLLSLNLRWLGCLLIVQYVVECINSVTYFRWVCSIENQERQ